MPEGTYYVKDWNHYQHYRDRIPAWIKLERSILHNHAVQSLKIEDRWRLITLWLIASEHHGSFTVAKAELRRSLGVATHYQALKVLARLEDTGLISQQDIRGVRGERDSKPLAKILIQRTENVSLHKKVFTYSTEFSQFWAAYPRKVGKGEAAKAFDRARLNGKLPEVLAAIESYKKTSQWIKDDGQFIPHPATWLNQRRWEDEPDLGGLFNAPASELTPEEAELGSELLDEANRNRPKYRSNH
jgi:hypothetical protein